MRALLLSSAALFFFGEAQAQSGSASDLDGVKQAGDIIVTARLREEPARDVPFALTVIDSDKMTALRVDDTLSLFRHAPGLSLTSFDDGRFAYFQLRGIGPLSQAISPDDGSVVTYVDGVPQPVYASEFAYYDLERIEVLRGPQGTLFGRNSQGGAINITTRPPTGEYTASARIEGAEGGYGLVQGNASGPIIQDRLYGSFAATASTYNGFVDNIAPGGGHLGDRESIAARSQLVFTPSSSSDARFQLTLNIDRQNSDPFYYVLRSQERPTVELNPENRVQRTAWGISLKSDLPAGFADLTAITAFNGFDNKQFTDDTDGLIYGPMFGLPSSAFLPPLDFSDWREEEKRFYQELRLADSTGAKTNWTAGVAYFQSDFDVELDNRSTFSPFLNGDRDASQSIRSYAAFTEMNAAIGSPRLIGSFGLRFTRDEKELKARFSGAGFPGTVASFTENSKADFNLWTGRGSLNWAVNDDLNIYATAGRGAKSGGFPRFTLSAALGAPSQAYKQSTSWTYETGLKGRLLGGRGRYEVSAFYNDVKDEQLFVLDFVSFQFLPVNLNTRTYGLELQGGLEILDGLSIDGALSWTENEIREASSLSGAAPGNPIPNVAPFSGSLSLVYEGDETSWSSLSFTPIGALSIQYVDTRAADVANNFSLPSYTNVDMRIGARIGVMEIYGFARNLFDEKQVLNGVLYAPGVEGVSIARGRIAGIGLKAAF